MGTPKRRRRREAPAVHRSIGGSRQAPGMAFWSAMPALSSVPEAHAGPHPTEDFLAQLARRLRAHPGPWLMEGTLALGERNRPGRWLILDLAPSGPSFTWTSFLPLDTRAALAFGDPARAHGDLRFARAFMDFYLNQSHIPPVRQGASTQKVHPKPPRAPTPRRTRPRTTG